MTAELVACALCGSERFEVLFQGKDVNLGTSDEVFQVVRCPECQLVYTNPRPTPVQMTRYYPLEYVPHHRGTKGREECKASKLLPLKKLMEESYLQRYRGGVTGVGWLLGLLGARLYGRRYSYLPPYVIAGRLLDVGCGSGAFLRLAIQAGWRGVGLDSSAVALDHARHDFGLEIVRVALPRLGLRDHTFDAVTMYMVLEHIHNPVETLQEIRRILKPDGILMLSVPDISSIEVKIFGPNWYSWDLPRHLYHFTPYTLRHMLNKAGFGVVRLWHERNILNLRGSLRHSFGEGKAATLARMFRLPRPLRSWLWKLSGWVWGSIGQSGRIAAIARVTKP